MTSLPAHQGILAHNYTIRYAEDTQRDILEDGAVRRTARLTRPEETTDLTLLLGDTAARDAFTAWAQLHAHEWFAMTLLHRRGEVRVVGGAPGITYRQRTRRSGRAQWEAALAVESRPLPVNPPMGQLVWPDYAQVLADDELGVGGIVRRTESPPVRQGDPTGRTLPHSYRLRVLLDSEHLAPFLEYCYAAVRQPIWWPTGALNTYQRRRLDEGLGSLTVHQTARQAGRMRWRAELALAGYQGDTRIILPPDRPGVVTLDDTTPTRGTAITASVSDPDGSINALTWQWQRGTTDISGATSATYTPVLADVGRVLRAVASYNDGHSSGKTATSAPTSAVANRPDRPGRVTLDDTTPTRGQQLRAALTDADTPLSSLTWQWQRGNANIPGATSATYTPVLADVGSRLRAVASYHDDHGRNKTATSAFTAIVANTIDQPGTVRIDDTTPVRATAITASLSDPDGNLTGITWQWQRGNTGITGATSATYTPVLADVGNRLRAVASYTDAHGAGKTASARTAAVANTIDQPGTVILNDTTPAVGVPVTATLWDPDVPVTGVTWQWQRGNFAISGATSATYTPVAADEGETLQVAVFYTDAHGPYKAIRSAPTAAVIVIPDQAGTVTIDDTTPTRGTAIAATLADEDGTVSSLTWQWQRGTTNIPGATSASYTPVLADVGSVLRAVASYNDAHGPGKTATSAATSAVVNTVDQAGVVTLTTTTPRIGAALTAALADADTPLSSLTWQWQRGTTNISGATSATYTPVEADVGQTLRAVASYTDAHGTGKTATSAATAAVARARTELEFSIGAGLLAGRFGIYWLSISGATIPGTWYADGKARTLSSIYLFANSASSVSFSGGTDFLSAIQSDLDITIEVDGYTITSTLTRTGVAGYGFRSARATDLIQHYGLGTTSTSVATVTLSTGGL